MGDHYDKSDALADSAAAQLKQDRTRDKTRAETADARCWACTHRKGTPAGGRAPVCKPHYVKLRMKMPVRLLEDGEPNDDGRR